MDPSSPATTTVSVTVTVAGGTATAGSDFVKEFTKGLTFSPGQFQKPIIIPVRPDTVAEGDEMVNVTLLNPTGGLALWRVAGRAVILNGTRGGDDG